MNIKLIAMDLDGTALQADHRSFSPRLTAALDAAHRKGVRIAPVTGRQFGLLPPAVLGHPVWEDLAVLCNGGQIRKLGTGECLHRLDISAEALHQLLILAARYDLPIEFSVDSKLYLTEESLQKQLPYPNLTFHRDTILANNGILVKSLEPMCAETVEKVNLLCINEELRARVAEDLKKIDVSAVWASSSSMEITHPDAAKGRGVARLCNLLGIPMEAVLALGDSGNDETMLRQAGLGIAMGNAPDFVKAAANAVTETNRNDGAALAIEQYVLK